MKNISLYCLFTLILSVFTATTVMADVVNVDKFKGLQRNPKADQIEDGSHSTFDNMYNLDGNLTVVTGTCDNCELLLHMDDLTNPNTFVDSSPTPHTVTRFGNAVQNATALKFGTGGGEFDGTGDYLSIPDSDNWNFGTGDFTIDFWYVRLSGTNQSVVSQFQDSNNNWTIYTNGTTQIVFQVRSGGSTIIDARWVDPGFAATQVHYQLVRQGSRFYMFRQGVEMSLYGATSRSRY
jgi:Concanavalin A-like lectin/glucanases superfamily